MSNQQMKVENMEFLIERMSSDCGPFQFVRELTENSIQAIQARKANGWKGQAKIVWDVDWHLVENDNVYKLEISDNGTGMTGAEIQKYINRLASSGREQGLQKNFGMGAKITALVNNPRGLIYKSWVNDEGVVAILCKDREAGYGLRQMKSDNGDFDYFITLKNDAKSNPIDECGTAVTLMGLSDDEDTFMPPGSTNKWLIKYLNDRYFEFPEGIIIQVRNFQKTDRSGWPTSRTQGMGDESGSQMRTIKGMKSFLDENSEKNGFKNVSGAKINWWILPKAGVKQGDIWESKAHCAALYQSELYDFTKGRSAAARIKEFGVPIGTQRVVLYVEPDSNDIDIISDLSRSSLKKGGESLPWSEWALEFRSAIPPEIKEMMDEEIASTKSEDNSENNRARLKEIQELLKYTRYRPSSNGNFPVDSAGTGGKPGDTNLGKRDQSGSGGSGGTAGNPYSDLTTTSPNRGERVQTDTYPQVFWLSSGETEFEEEMIDRAAYYDKTNNVLKMNKDYWSYRELIQFFAKEYDVGDDDNRLDVLTKKVAEILELQAVEVILTIRSLKSEKNWSGDPIDRALTPESLTASLSSRYAIIRIIRQAISQAIGAKS